MEPPSLLVSACLSILEHFSESKSISTSKEHTVEARKRLLQQCERSPTDLERELIKQIPQFLYEYVASLGCTPKKVDLDRIHFYESTGLDDRSRAQLTEPNVKGSYRPLEHTILVFANGIAQSPLDIADTLVHEMFHSQGFSNMGDESPTSSDKQAALQRQQRIGIRIIRPDLKITYFKDLDEAVIVTLTSKFLSQYGNRIPALAEELQRRSRFINALPEEVLELAHQDILRIADSRDERTGGWTTEVIRYPYPQERDQLTRLVTDLREKNSADFADSEKVFQLFVQAVLQGRLLPLARAIERTYGRGSFRRVGVEGASAVQATPDFAPHRRTG